MTSILVTGASGYIGSHAVLALIRAGHDVVGVDNLCNSSIKALHAVERLTNTSVPFVQADLRDRAAIEAVLDRHRIDAVMHFAGLKAVGESVASPLRYFDNNVTGSVVLLEAMASRGVKRLVFSSSATVYGDAATSPISEDAPTRPASPYGRTKRVIEQMLEDQCAADPALSVSVLRYFNPVGAHESGELGEDPCGVPNNLLPFIAQVAVGRLPELKIFGADYDTRDGTGIRDYIHVVDLVAGHLAALQYIDERSGIHVHNLGTGRGHSVREVVAAFERASGQSIPTRVVGRRPGDIATSFADASKAARELNWRAQIGIDAMCADAWRWQSRHPHGFR